MGLSDKRFTEIANLFSVFTFSMMQGFVQMSNMLKKHGIRPEEIDEYVQENREAMNQGVNFNRDYMQGKIKMKTCPKCGGVMELETVNTCKGNQVPGGFKSVYTCSRYTECGHQMFSKNSVAIEQYKHWKKIGAFDKYRQKRQRTHNGPAINVEKEMAKVK